MAEPKAPPAAICLFAIFSRHTSCLEWATDRIAERFGQIALSSPHFEHRETDYYQSQMGSGLIKQFLIPTALFDPGRLASIKLESNGWEAELAASQRFSELRPVNIDPGYITLDKLVLASAKSRAHRIYLTDGIYAEDCLHYIDQRWQTRPWTYPDYCRADFHEFFTQARNYLRTL